MMKRLISTAFTSTCLKTMPKGKIAAIACLPLLLVEAVFVPAAIALDGEKLYHLCSHFPLNSQCQGYETPISLDDRLGKTGDCIFKNNEVENRGLCKITVNEAGITIYQETGKELKIINDKKSTRTIQITPTSVSGMEYREDEKNNTGAKVVNTILFGIAGLLLTPNKKVSEIQVNYTPTTPQSAFLTSLRGRGAQEKLIQSLRCLPAQALPCTSAQALRDVLRNPDQDTSQEKQSVNSLRVVIERETGREMRSQLEKITGRQAETPQAKPEATN